MAEGMHTPNKWPRMVSWYLSASSTYRMYYMIHDNRKIRACNIYNAVDTHAFWEIISGCRWYMAYGGLLDLGAFGFRQDGPTWYPNLNIRSMVRFIVTSGRSKQPYLHALLSEHLELHIQPIELQISWIVSFLVRTPRNGWKYDQNRNEWKLGLRTTLVGIIKVHCIQTDNSHFIWNDFRGVIRAALKNL